MTKPVEYNATLIEREDLTDLLAIFRFQPDEPLPPAPWFVPGQYCVVGMNNTIRPELGSTQRAMSIGSAPQECDHVEFYIRYVDLPTSDNPLTHLLWMLQIGDRAYVRAVPKGRFTVRHLVGDDDPRLQLFVAAGTGLAPFVSIVRSHLNDHPGESLEKFAILHGASYPEDLGYRSELEELRDRHGLRYIPTVSRPKERPSWDGAHGRAEDLFREEVIADTESRLGLEPGGIRPSEVAVYVCGLQGTIGRCIERLAVRGFVPDHRGIRKALSIPDEAPANLFYEQYDHEPVIDLNDEALVARLSAEIRAAL